ncbi:hypothetical protein HanXRQr2_Chr12g0520831 [Helianthus annuus]|nr:hypothetical protein HanXRQr2_Chr12g0520831 [Helianthus annuus]KAJ0491168.1 hypothetical protein HanIR_Chr12g0560951 [Helianthus annuus]KAJ0503691.1 hypothetical protein HanHA89_Chr12g0451221 [Helianthus annuus]KAJ0673360.1 hypothetical protein HanLR1_Chr12g0428391 [Helianthus annuus]KAJ0861025.1 hypothetical protein HanPSC8_Chr12g0502071 [Helianthus annuus]
MVMAITPFSGHLLITLLTLLTILFSMVGMCTLLITSARQHCIGPLFGVRLQLQMFCCTTVLVLRLLM